MGGRLHVIVLMVAVAARPSMQRNDVLYGVADRCWNTVGEQAGVDLLNLVYQLSVCTRSEDLYGETMTALMTKGPKEAIKTACRRKDELLTCSDQAFETIKRCLNEKEEQGLAILQGRVEPLMDFLCEHDNDIAAIHGSQEEIQCLTSLGERVDRCNPYQAKGAEEMLNYLESLDQECKKVDTFMECVNVIPGNCKNSIALYLLNAMMRELVEDAICSIMNQVIAARKVSALVSTLP